MPLSDDAQQRSRLPLRVGRSLLFPSFIKLSIFAALLCNAALVPNPIIAQSGTSEDEVIRVRTDLVTVPLFVADAHGQRVNDLTQSDFALRDNGNPVKISYFAAGTEHVALAFALDQSGSTREIAAQQHEAALALFSRFGRGSRVAVLRFGEKVELASPFTTNPEEARAAFDSNTKVNQRTAIFDAALASVRAFDAMGGTPTERRIVILISDGLDNASRADANEVIKAAIARAVSIYVVHLPLFEPRDGRLAARPASKGFRALAEKTGGRYFMVGDAQSALDGRAPDNLAPVFKTIEEDLQSQYVIGYYPDAAGRNTRSHRIEINLTSHAKRRLRVRSFREEYTLKQ